VAEMKLLEPNKHNPSSTFFLYIVKASQDTGTDLNIYESKVPSCSTSMKKSCLAHLKPQPAFIYLLTGRPTLHSQWTFDGRNMQRVLTMSLLLIDISRHVSVEDMGTRNASPC